MDELEVDSGFGVAVGKAIFSRSHEASHHVFEDGVSNGQVVGEADLTGIPVPQFFDQSSGVPGRDVQREGSQRFIGSSTPAEVGGSSRCGHGDGAGTAPSLGPSLVDSARYIRVAGEDHSDRLSRYGWDKGVFALRQERELTKQERIPSVFRTIERQVGEGALVESLTR